jgi:hypothetical protein
MRGKKRKGNESIRAEGLRPSTPSSSERPTSISPLLRLLSAPDVNSHNSHACSRVPPVAVSGLGLFLQTSSSQQFGLCRSELVLTLFLPFLSLLQLLSCRGRGGHVGVSQIRL